MKHHHTKTKGDLGVMKVAADLAEQGRIVLVPLSEFQTFDLVSWDGQAFSRIQVKYREVDRKGAITVNLRSCWNDRHGTHITPMDKAEYDVIAIYCPNTKEVYYVGKDDVEKSVTLRTRPPRNKQLVGVRFASDYRLAP
jgi:hypothetical protein